MLDCSWNLNRYWRETDEKVEWIRSDWCKEFNFFDRFQRGDSSNSFPRHVVINLLLDAWMTLHGHLRSSLRRISQIVSSNNNNIINNQGIVCENQINSVVCVCWVYGYVCCAHTNSVLRSTSDVDFLLDRISRWFTVCNVCTFTHCSTILSLTITLFTVRGSIRLIWISNSIPCIRTGATARSIHFSVRHLKRQTFGNATCILYSLLVNPFMRHTRISCTIRQFISNY